MEELQANSYPSVLGRNLRKCLSGDNGLVSDMIESENSAVRMEADKDATAVFKGTCLF